MGKKKFVKKEQIDFSTLPKIMEHFFNVPFPQFQTDLNKWFREKMSEREGVKQDGIKHANIVTDHFLNVVQEIFNTAERKSTEGSAHSKFK